MAGGDQRPPQVLDRGAGRLQRECPPARPLRIIERLGPFRGLREVECKVAQPGFQGTGVGALDRGRDVAMEGLALAREQRRIDRLTGQRVAEGELVGRDLDDELGGDELLHRGEERPFVAPGQGLQGVEVEAATGDGGERQDLGRRRAEPFGPALDGVVDGPRDLQLRQRFAIPGAAGVEDAAGGEEGFEDLLDEEGVAVGQGEEGVEEIGARGPAELEDGAQHRVDVVGREARQRQLGGKPSAIEFGQQVCELGLDLVAAIRRQEQDRQRGDPAGEREQDLETGVVAPVEVFDDQEERSPRREAFAEGDQGLDEASLFLGGVRGRCRRQTGQQRDEFRHELREFGRGGAEGLPHLVRPVRPEVAAQQVLERGVGEDAVGFEARPLKETHAGGRGDSVGGNSGSHLGDQTRFPDSGLAGDQGDAATSGAGTGSLRVEHAQTFRPTDENRADDRSLGPDRCGAGHVHRRLVRPGGAPVGPRPRPLSRVRR